MAAPLKEHNNTYGNPKNLLTILFVLLFLGGGSLLLITTSPRNTKTNPISKENSPQVQGDVIEKEAESLTETTNKDAPKLDVQEQSYEVVSVSDGDTIKVRVADKIETVRLIGVDTPETNDPRKPVQCYGQQASDFTKKSLLNSKVTLTSDDSQQNRDKYGRLLRYAYTTGGQNFNLLLIASGYAYEYTYKLPYQFQTDFKNAQEEAKQNKLGLWNDSTCAGVR